MTVQQLLAHTDSQELQDWIAFLAFEAAEAKRRERDLDGADEGLVVWGDPHAGDEDEE